MIGAEAALQGWLDSPSEGAHCAEFVEVMGWACSTEGSVDRVEVLVAGRSLGFVTEQRPRPDVAAALSLSPSVVHGFHQFLRLDGCDEGTVPLVVRASDSAGNQRSFACTIVVSRPKIQALIDHPAEGTRCMDGVKVSGWAFSTAGKIERVEIFVGERLLGEAVYGYERIDVASKFRDATYDAVGFAERFRFPAGLAEAGRETLVARFFDDAGNSLRVDRPILVAADGPEACASPSAVRIEIDELMSRVRSAIALSERTGEAPASGSYEASFISGQGWTSVTVRTIFAMLAEIGRAPADLTAILDFGLGSPQLLAELGEHLPAGAIVAATDSRSAIDRATEWSLGVPVTLLPSSRLFEWKDRHFDLVLDTGLLARMDRRSRRAWLAEIHRVLKPDGVAVVNFEAALSSPDSADTVPVWTAAFEACPPGGIYGDGRSPWMLLQPRASIRESSPPPMPSPEPWPLRPGTNDSAIVRSVFDQNEYRLPDRFSADDVVIDIGSHIGSFSVAVLLRGAGTVRAYEPDFGNWQRAKRALRPFGDRALVERQVVWRSDRPALPLAISPYGKEGDLDNTGDPGVMMPLPGSTLVSSVAFDRVLDRAAGHRNRRIRLVKLDCEGSEYPILYTSRSLDRVDALCGEYHNLERLCGAVPEIAAVAGCEGYDGLALCRFLRGRGFIVQLRPGHHLLGNFFAYRPSSGFAFR